MYEPGPQPSGMPPGMVVDAILRRHPAPWTYRTMPNGQVFVIDQVGQQVALFAVCDFAVAASRSVVEVSAPYNQSAPTDTPKANG